jgi:Uma2 family endonuclease
MSEITNLAGHDSVPDAPARDFIWERCPAIAIDMPVMFEDEGQEEMGETDIHTKTTATLFYGLTAYCASRPELQVFSDLNCYYHPVKRWAYFSADVMVVAPRPPLVEPVTSYRISEACPPPLLVVEVLSRRSFQQQDLTNKPEIYADLGVAEYILADLTGQFLPQQLLLKRLLPDSAWKDEQDADGGVTSRLGFRILIEGDGQLRLIHAQTGTRYARPEEAQAEADRARTLEKELADLRAQLAKESKTKGKRRKP